MKRLLPIFILVLAGALTRCAPDEPAETAGQMPLVVEGWIEEGMTPVIMVTHAVDLSGDSASFDGFVEKWARVSVYDGERQYMMTGRVNKDYVPSFIYTNSRLRGQAGHTYRLVVETETDTVEAETTLLPSPRLVRVESVAKEGSDSLYSLRAFVEGIEPDGYYKFFSMTRGLENRYFGTFMGTLKGSMYDPEEGWTITRGVHAVYNDSVPFEHYFAKGSRVSVKVSAIDRELYEFWEMYESNVSISQNLLFTFAGNCPGNIRGGLGYWAAYGESRVTVTVGR